MVVDKGKHFIGRFNKDEDLLLEITQFCVKNNIKLGTFYVIGAVQKANIGYYNQEKKVYIPNITLNKKMEIVSCLGNVSLKENKPFVHAHIVLADEEGKCFGGHLLLGNIIWAAEYYLQELAGIELNREYDRETGLNIWPKN